MGSESWQARGGLRVSSRSGMGPTGVGGGMGRCGARVVWVRFGWGPVGQGRPCQPSQVGWVGPAPVPLRNSPQPTILYFRAPAFAPFGNPKSDHNHFSFPLHWPIFSGVQLSTLLRLWFGEISPPGIHDSPKHRTWKLPHDLLSYWGAAAYFNRFGFSGMHSLRRSKLIGA